MSLRPEFNSISWSRVVVTVFLTCQSTVTAQTKARDKEMCSKDQSPANGDLRLPQLIVATMTH